MNLNAYDWSHNLWWKSKRITEGYKDDERFSMLNNNFFVVSRVALGKNGHEQNGKNWKILSEHKTTEVLYEKALENWLIL